MQIKLKSLSALERVSGSDLVLELQGKTARDLLEKLESLYGDEFKKYTGEEFMEAMKKYNMIVNKRTLRFPKDLDYQFADGDSVVLLHVTGGG